MVLAFDMPAKNRMKKNIRAFTAAPDRALKAAKAPLAMPTMGPRRKRSASHPIGPAPSTKNISEAVLMAVMAPSLTSKLSPMLGPKMATALFSNSSRLFSANSTMKVWKPPLRRPSLRVVCSPPTPGSRSSGNNTSAFWASRRAASPSSTVVANASMDSP